MGIQSLSEHVVLIALPPESQSGDEADREIRSAGERMDVDVIVDFSLVEIMSSGTLCSLIVLERMLSAVDRQLILCSVPRNIAGIFTRVGLNALFRFARDRSAALQSLDHGEDRHP
jgi:anti-anti-sigma regulatory factor